MQKPLPERVGKLPATPPSAAGVPAALLDRVKADLSGRTGAATAQIEVHRAQPAVWRDGALGCPEPGQHYTQALVEGYWIVLRHDGKTYDYRVGSHGYFKLCAGHGQPPQPDNPSI